MSAQTVDVVQTAGIVFICILLSYCIWRLERAIGRGAEVVRGVMTGQREIQDGFERLWKRIDEIEMRQGVRSDSQNMLAMRKLAEAIQDWIKASEGGGDGARR